MIVHFSGSARNIENDIHKYRAIINTVRNLGHSIAHDWIETAWLMSQGKGRDARGWNLDEIVLEVESGIEMAEVVIVEASGGSTFGVGYELAFALQRKKPALVLVEKDKMKNSYAGSLKHALLTVKPYTLKDVGGVVEEFIKENTVTTKDLRFNFVMDRQIYNHLRAKSYKTGKTKAEVVRDLLLHDIDFGVK